MSARDFVEGEAVLDDEENENEEEQEEDYDGEVHEGAGTMNHYNDSSEEEEEDDDDEEAARAVCYSCLWSAIKSKKKKIKAETDLFSHLLDPRGFYCR
jgi:TATA-binding protein-associated factor Taf7